MSEIRSPPENVTEKKGQAADRFRHRTLGDSSLAASLWFSAILLVTFLKKSRIQKGVSPCRLRTERLLTGGSPLGPMEFPL
jgi:hypothetical protein